ncbi:acetyltransferase [Streptomyces abyssalis]|uniref:Acetyltransferase n=1 Tax=Streptomyces abyssalis TaxID=933944 RepID=A0A1E7JGG7_9ACTN|nr:GNAT family N-acetyltransferase [Streptomyces abyssalis]OEU85547.1 acetyltransferase [Streptomyces abyssalis]OEU92989.1 acetyltransferase [Streptomyces abyssalis]OEV30186.1 acetyltransferase [Streptomyces nanshensis]
MDITIRPARDEELEGVGELTARAYLEDGLLTFGADDPYLTHLRAARRRAEHTEILVAVDTASDSVLGAVAFVGDGGEYADLAGPGEGEFRMLAVRPEGRGRGAGEALVRACIDKARERGLSRLVLCSHDGMTTAHRLYGRLGFVPAPERDWEPIPGLALHAFTLEL